MTTPANEFNDLPTSQRELLTNYASVQPRHSRLTSALADLTARLCASLGISAEITSRTKDLASLHAKLRRKSYSTLSDIPDLSGVRIIVQYQSDVERICSMLREEFSIVEDEPHAFENPESFGYISRHMIVTLSPERATLREWEDFADLQCEFQVRTILQHAWASISHSLDYKFEHDAPADVRRKLFQVAALIEIGDNLFQEFRRELMDIQSAYAASTRSGTWRDLPIDIDSLRTTLSEWIPDELVENFESRGIVVASLEERPESQEGKILSTIAELSRALSIRTMGELADTARDSGCQDDMLNRFTADGAFTPDYLVLLMLYVRAKQLNVRLSDNIDEAWHTRSVDVG